MGRLSIFRFLREQWTTIPRPTLDVHGKTIIITGATNGLGLEVTRQLQESSPQTLILTSRDIDKVVEVEKFLGSGAAAPQHDWRQLDLASFASVSSFVDSIGDSSIECLLANAAIATGKYCQTTDGWESTLQVNYLSNALLIVLLLPNLIKASSSEEPSRATIVSSDAHYQLPSIDSFRNAPNILEALNDKAFCTASVMKQRYMVSKFLAVAFVRELANRLASPTPVIVASVNPGFCKSKLTREIEAKFPGSLLVPLLKAAIARPTETGARVLVHFLTDTDERKMHGHFVTSCEVAEESDLLLGRDGMQFSQKLWSETIAILELVDPRVKEILKQYTVESSA